MGHRPSGERVGHERHALLYGFLVPEAAILLGERDQGAVGQGAGRAPGVREQHERQEPRRLAVVGQQPAEGTGQPDRLAGELRAPEVGAGGGGVAFVEDQVQDVQDHPQPVRLLGLRGHAEGDAALLDGPLGPADALGHGRLGDEEGPGDLGGGQAANGPQGEGDLGGRRERGVAAHKQECQRVVVALGLLLFGGGLRRGLGDRRLCRGRLLAAPAGGLCAPDPSAGGRRR